MGKYALIVEPDPGRAAQYGFRAERRGLSATLTTSAEEALFEVSLAGPPQLMVLEARLPDCNGLELLGDLRRVVAMDARAILIVDSREAHDAAARQMIPLGIAALLPQSHSTTALDRAIDAALAGGAPATPPPAPPELPPEAEVTVPDFVDDPLLRELSRAPGLQSLTPEALKQVAATTASTFKVPIALLWVSTSRRLLFEMHLNAAIPPSSLLRDPVRWHRVRALLGGTPLYVPDLSEPPLFNDARSDSRLPASLAAAPLSVDGKAAGGVLIVQPHVVGVLDRRVLEPLTLWAQRISGDVERLLAGTRPPVPARASTARAVPRAAVLESVVAGLDAALLVSDASGLSAFGTPLLAELLELDADAIAGQPRALVLRNLSSKCGAEDAIVSAIVGARHDAARELTFETHRPDRRILRWRGRPIDVGGVPGLLDEFTDFTAELEAVEEREALVRVDAVTGLPNRVALDEALGREIPRALRSGMPFSIVVFALDHPALGAGFTAGEEEFRKLASLLRSTARGYDLAARVDRLRLLVVLSDTLGDQAKAFAERYLSEVRKRAATPPITVSGGVAQFDGNRTFREMLADASAKLAEARRQGGDRVL